MTEITKQMMDTKMMGIALRLPKDVHSYLKAQAILAKKKKSDFFLDLLILGLEQYRNKDKN